MNKKENVSSLDFSRAFQALDEINNEEYTGKTEYVVKKQDLYEGFKKPETVLESFMEDFYSLSDEKDVEQAAEDTQDEIAKAKLDKIEKIVDLDAKSVEDLQPSYAGKFIIQCPQCLTLFYKNPEDIVYDENDSEVVNVNEPCQHCGNDSGYTLIGKVEAASPEEVEKEEAPEEAEAEVEEETTSEEPEASGDEESASEEGEDDGIDDLNAIMDEVDVEETQESLNKAEAAPSDNETENKSEEAKSLNESTEVLIEGPVQWVKKLAKNHSDKKILKLLDNVAKYPEDKVIRQLGNLLEKKGIKFDISILNLSKIDENARKDLIKYLNEHKADEGVTKVLDTFAAAVTFAKQQTSDVKANLAFIYDSKKDSFKDREDFLLVLAGGKLTDNDKKRLDSMLVAEFLQAKDAQTAKNPAAAAEEAPAEDNAEPQVDAAEYQKYFDRDFQEPMHDSLNVAKAAPSDHETENKSEEAESLNEGKYTPQASRDEAVNIDYYDYDVNSALSELKKKGKAEFWCISDGDKKAQEVAKLFKDKYGKDVEYEINDGYCSARVVESVNNPENASENETENAPEAKTLNEEDLLDISDEEFNKIIDSAEAQHPLSDEEVEQNIEEINSDVVEESLTEDADLDAFEAEVNAALDKLNFEDDKAEEVDFDTDSFDECVLESLTDVYSNVVDYQTTNKTFTEDRKLVVEGLITFENKNTQKTSFVFNQYKKDDKDSLRIKFKGLNESLNLKTIISTVQDMNTLYTEKLKYQFNIDGNLVEGLSKRK